MNRILYLLFFFSLFTAPFLIAQELNCRVNINIESVQSSQRDYLRNFASDIERYMNNTRFTDEDLDGDKIPCNIEIYFKSGTSDNRYQVRMIITSQRPIYDGDEKTDRTTPVTRILDDNWEFTYIPNQRMNHEEMIFDPLTGFLDFYAFLLIGYDLETYIPFSGASCFRKALNLVQMASNSAASNDWKSSTASYSKYGIAEELTSPRFDNFRIAFNNYYFDGVDLLTSERPKALENMLKSIEAINTVRRQSTTNVLVKQFFDAKYREIAEAFITYPDRSVYETLSLYDEEHRSTYQEFKARQ